MMKNLLLLFLLVSFGTHSQEYDTVIKTKVYTSYYSTKLKSPLLLSYDLYQGGGDCSRATFQFKNTTKIVMANEQDYKGSGYDKGHLCPAEDMAKSCDSLEHTFRFENCLPQTPSLNRGVMSKWENTIRKSSLKDSLHILVGGSDYRIFIGSKVFVPNYCWKLVLNKKTGKPLYILWFTNCSVATVEELKTIKQLEKKLGYSLDNYLK
jgi:endonuclease G